jgi:hypothetical protein
MNSNHDNNFEESPSAKERIDLASYTMISVKVARDCHFMKNGNNGKTFLHFFFATACLVKTLIGQFPTCTTVSKENKDRLARLIMSRVRAGIFSQFTGGPNINQNFELASASLFCKHYPAKRRYAWFEKSGMIEKREKFRRCGFEIAFKKYLVPFSLGLGLGRISMTTWEFQRILEILIDSMESWIFGFQETIDAETTVDGIGDCPVSDYTMDMGMLKSPRRMQELDDSQEALDEISGRIVVLKQILQCI